MNLIKTLFSRRWLIPTAVVILGMIFLARLGFWQLDRLEWRREQNAALVTALNAPPIQLNTNVLPDDLGPLKNVDATARGTFDFNAQIIVKLQNRNGRSGFHLITPLLLDGMETAVLVNRGWLPDSERNNIAAYNEPGEQIIDGYIALDQALNRGEGASDAPKAEWYRVDIPAIERQLPYPTLPVYLIQSPAPQDDPDALPARSERTVDLSEGSHLGYAVQWFLFSLTLGAIYLIYVYKQME